MSWKLIPAIIKRLRPENASSGDSVPLFVNNGRHRDLSSPSCLSQEFVGRCEQEIHIAMLPHLVLLQVCLYCLHQSAPLSLWMTQWLIAISNDLTHTISTDMSMSMKHGRREDSARFFSSGLASNTPAVHVLCVPLSTVEGSENNRTFLKPRPPKICGLGWEGKFLF